LVSNGEGAAGWVSVLIELGLSGADWAFGSVCCAVTPMDDAINAKQRNTNGERMT
jgi:hypothetical protein